MYFLVSEIRQSLLNVWQTEAVFSGFYSQSHAAEI